jgi:3-deoxy-D-manno-octulosonate 8-phosphate phosphatase (KDO 8-P phosphatase)
VDATPPMTSVPVAERLEDRLSRVQLLLLDCDGVLTSGGVTWSSDGIEQKTFHIRDGLGIRLWQRVGGSTAIITGRSSELVQKRADELEIRFVYQAVQDKLAVAAEILDATGCSWDEAAFVGDDLPDLPVMQRCGVAVAVADACAEVRRAACLVTELPGGQGAVREIIERMLRARGRWDAVVAEYAGVRRGSGEVGWQTTD